MFIDDLQWADLASLRLIKSLMAEQQHLLLIGAYRDNEVSSAHPLMLTVADLKEANTPVNTLTLGPLKQRRYQPLSSRYAALYCGSAQGHLPI